MTKPQAGKATEYPASGTGPLGRGREKAVRIPLWREEAVDGSPRWRLYGGPKARVWKSEIRVTDDGYAVFSHRGFDLDRIPYPPWLEGHFAELDDALAHAERHLSDGVRARTKPSRDAILQGAQAPARLGRAPEWYLDHLSWVRLDKVGYEVSVYRSGPGDSCWSIVSLAPGKSRYGHARTRTEAMTAVEAELGFSAHMRVSARAALQKQLQELRILARRRGKERRERAGRLMIVPAASQ
jgi:hypothetical protein